MRNVFQFDRILDKGFFEAKLVKCHSTEITGSTAATSEGNYIDKEAQLVKNMNDHRVSEKATEEEEDEPMASLSRSSSSEGIWPSSDAVERGYQQQTSLVGIPFFILLSINQ